MRCSRYGLVQFQFRNRTHVTSHTAGVSAWAAGMLGGENTYPLAALFCPGCAPAQCGFTFEMIESIDGSVSLFLLARQCRTRCM